MAKDCPRCGGELKPDDINIAQGVALCRGCGHLSSLAEVVATTIPIDQLVNDPPWGCAIQDNAEEAHIRVSLRSIRRVLLMMPIAVVWTGMAASVALLALKSLYAHLAGAVSESDDVLPMGGAIFTLFIVTPFVILGLGMIVSVLLACFGYLDIRIADRQGTARASLGPFGRTRRFDPTDVHNVGIQTVQRRNGPRPFSFGVLLDGRKRDFYVGSTLPPERMKWLEAVLRHLLVYDRQQFASR